MTLTGACGSHESSLSGMVAGEIFFVLVMFG